jgi:hypothetical protein
VYVTRDTFEYVQLTPEGRYLNVQLDELHESQVVEVCDVCEEPGTSDDALGHFGRPDVSPYVYVIAHYLCGIDEGLTLS